MFGIHFDVEFTLTREEVTGERDGMVFAVAKVGGGTLGQAYEGAWEWAVVAADGSIADESVDTHTLVRTGAPKTHREVAEIVMDFYDAGH